jgi:hypothetical protein
VNEKKPNVKPVNEKKPNNKAPNVKPKAPNVKPVNEKKPNVKPVNNKKPNNKAPNVKPVNNKKPNNKAPNVKPVNEKKPNVKPVSEPKVNKFANQKTLSKYLQNLGMNRGNRKTFMARLGKNKLENIQSNAKKFMNDKKKPNVKPQAQGEQVCQSKDSLKVPPKFGYEPR